MRKISVLFYILIIGLLSCDGSEEECTQGFQPPVNFDLDVEADNINTIEEYLSENNLTAEKTANDLYYVISNAGSEFKPDLCSRVLCAYTGYLPNGDIFDSSDEEGIEFGLQSVVKGWQEGIPLIGAGGQIQLLIPSKLGYGRNPPSIDIPENSVLIFDVNLLAF